jgi:RecB family endonuclease NucS
LVDGIGPIYREEKIQTIMVEIYGN